MPSTNKRWVCPACAQGCLAPSKPRMDDVRRYCLPCSAKTGRLVRRTCPTLDKQRATRAAQAKEKRAKQRVRKSAARDAVWVHQGCDLEVEAKALWRAMYAEKRTVPPLPVIRLRRGTSYSRSGRAEWRIDRTATYERTVVDHVTVCFHPDRPLVDVLMVLAHELAHHAAGLSARHGKRWADVYARGVLGRYGRQEVGWARPESGYAMDGWVTEVIRLSLATTA